MASFHPSMMRQNDGHGPGSAAVVAAARRAAGTARRGAPLDRLRPAAGWRAGRTARHTHLSHLPGRRGAGAPPWRRPRPAGRRGAAHRRRGVAPARVAAPRRAGLRPGLPADLLGRHPARSRSRLVRPPTQPAEPESDGGGAGRGGPGRAPTAVRRTHRAGARRISDRPRLRPSRPAQHARPPVVGPAPWRHRAADPRRQRPVPGPGLPPLHPRLRPSAQARARAEPPVAGPQPARRRPHPRRGGARQRLQLAGPPASGDAPGRVRLRFAPTRRFSRPRHRSCPPGGWRR